LHGNNWKQLETNSFSRAARAEKFQQDSFNNELVVGQLPAGKNVSTEADNFAGVCHQATAGEDTAG
jgi:hypothetical protein